MASDAEILAAAKKLRRTGNMNTWYRCDLHVHTWASPDYGSGISPAPTQDPDGFVAEFVNAGVGVIAVTDHHTSASIDQLRAAAKRREGQPGRPITILPGVELCVSPGVHLTAIFPEDVPAATIDDLLSALGIPPQARGKTESLVTEPIQRVHQMVKDRGGFLVAAHIGSTNGLWEELDGQTRIQWLREVDAIEINSRRDAESAEMDLRRVRGIRPDIPVVYSSDSHDATAPPTMHVKMYAPSYRGLSQLLFEPELRVSRHEAPSVEHAHIVGFTVRGGIYDGAYFRLSPHLNAVIGGRGAGKSAMLDLLRFVFGSEPRSSEEDSDRPRRFRKRLKDFLQGIGEIIALIEVRGVEYAVTRQGTYQAEGRDIRFTGDPEVYGFIDGDPVRFGGDLQSLFPVEFFGQGEVGALSERTDEQMTLLDEALGVDPQYEVERELQTLAQQHEQKIAVLETQIDALSDKISQEQSHTGRLAELQVLLTDPAFAEHGFWLRQQHILSQANDGAVALKAQAQDVGLIGELLAPEENDRTVGRTLVDRVRAILAAARRDVLRLSDQRDEIVQDARDAIQRAGDEWDPLFRDADDAYRDALLAGGLANRNALANEQEALKNALSEIEHNHRPALAEAQSKRQAARVARDECVAKLRDLWAKRRLDRQGAISKLAASLPPELRVDLDEHADLSDVERFLNSALEGSGMQNRPSKVSDLVSKASLVDISRALERREIQAFQDWDVALGDAERFVSAVKPEQALALERVAPRDVPTIRVKRGEEFAPLDDLSVGEKCSAILSIALRDRSKPLVIDQPEDDLDHEFITNSVVGGLRSVKATRQVITATHNPNIPVLGDAEMVFKVSRSPGEEKCLIEAQGGLEREIVTEQVQMLEGGPDAFKRRGQRYA